MPRKPKITAKTGQKTENMGSTSHKNAIFGPIFRYFGLTGMNIRKNESVEQGVAPYVTQGVPRVNPDVRTENECCGNRQSKGATATHIRW